MVFMCQFKIFEWGGGLNFVYTPSPTLTEQFCKTSGLGCKFFEIEIFSGKDILTWQKDTKFGKVKKKKKY